MSPESAKLVKYASNTFLATKVSYVNTIANICQTIPGVDVSSVAGAIGLDPRIGSLFLKAGPGYGGSCFHKDLQAIIRFGETNGYDSLLFRATEEANHLQTSRVLELARNLVGSLEGKMVAVLGLAFKKDTDDVREAASIRLINRLLENGADVVGYDPMATENARKILSNGVLLVKDPHLALKDADCCIIMTEWDELRDLKPDTYLRLMRAPNLVEARRLYNPKDFRKLNFAGSDWAQLRNMMCRPQYLNSSVDGKPLSPNL
jgi:UDPglucose 6-dehydrogenase